MIYKKPVGWAYLLNIINWDMVKLANAKLEELNKITDTVSLTLLGDYQMRRGVLIPLKREDLELNDRYLIKTSDHIISDSKEIVTIKIEKFTGESGEYKEK